MAASSGELVCALSGEMGARASEASLPLPLLTVGTFSCRGFRASENAAVPTASKINQDRGCVCYQFGRKAQALFCVFDGHGPHGHSVAAYSAHHLPHRLLQHAALESEPQFALSECIVALDEAIRQDDTIDSSVSGTTAVCCLLLTEADGHTCIHAANVGDSRAVIGHTTRRLLKVVPAALALTVDLTPDVPAERERIERCGGFISPAAEPDPARVWHDATMSAPGGLAVSRSIGDHSMR